jgi:hypothetical protein
VGKEQNFQPRYPEKDAEKQMVGQIVEQVREWHQRSGEKELVIGKTLKGHERAWVHTALGELHLGAAGWRGFFHEKAGKYNLEGIRLTRATQEEAARHDATVRKQTTQDIEVRCRVLGMPKHYPTATKYSDARMTWWGPQS